MVVKTLPTTLPGCNIRNSSGDCRGWFYYRNSSMIGITSAVSHDDASKGEKGHYLYRDSSKTNLEQITQKCERIATDGYN